MSPLLQAALALAARGMRVFPLPPRKKEPPLFEGWQKYASTDAQKIESWWRNPDNNIGIATGEGSRIWVLDVDGDDGEETLRQLEAKHGLLPPTVEAITGDGRHIYFRWPTETEIRNSQCRDNLPGLDWRGDGGYVLAPPSTHPSGRRYAWSVDSVSEFADAPDWLIQLVTSTSNGAPVAAATPESWRSFIDEDVDGSRRGHAVARLYGLLVRRYIDPIVALGIVRNHNKLHCRPPLEDDEVVRIANDIANREANRRENRS